MNLNGDIIIDGLSLTDYISDFNIDKPELQNGLHKALVVIYNPGGRWNTTCNIGKSVEMKLGWGSSPATFFKGDIFDRKIKDGNKLELFIGQKGWNGMLFQSEDEIILDKEVSDIVVDVMSGSGVGVTNVEFGSGAEVIRTGFHSDGFPTDDTVDETSNVTHVPATDLIPADQDAWTEEIYEEYLTEEGTEDEAYMVSGGTVEDETTIVDTGIYSKKLTKSSTAVHMNARRILSQTFSFEELYKVTLKIYVPTGKFVSGDKHLRLVFEGSHPSGGSSAFINLQDHTRDTWVEHEFYVHDNRGDWYGSRDDDFQFTGINFYVSKSIGVGGDYFYVDDFTIYLKTWDDDIDDRTVEASKETIIKQAGGASIKGTHKKKFFYDDFSGDAHGVNPANWSVIENGTTNIYASSTAGQQYKNRRCCFLGDEDGTNNCSMTKDIGGGGKTETNGRVEFVWRQDNNSLNDWGYFYLKDDGGNYIIRLRLRCPSGEDYHDIDFYNGSSWEHITILSLRRQYMKVRIDYDLTADTFNLYTWGQNDSGTSERFIQRYTNKAFENTTSNMRYIIFETEAVGQCKLNVSDIWWGTPSGGSDSDRELFHPRKKDKALDCELYSVLNFHTRQNVTDEDPVLRLYSSDGNFFYRTLDITSADTFQEFNIDVGSAASGWSETGIPDWENINWIAFYWAAAHTDVTATYVDKLYFGDPSGAYYRLTKDADDPVDKELGTENESGQWSSNEFLTVGDSTDPKHTGDYSTSLGDAAADHFTDDETVEFDGDLTCMVNTGDKLSMLAGELITQTALNAEECVGESGNPLYHATKFKAKGNRVTTVGLRLRNDDNGSRVFYWQLRATWGGANLKTGNTSVTGFFNSWKDISVGYTGLTVGTWYYLRVAGEDDRCFWKRQSTDVNADLIFVNSGGGDEAQDFTCTFDFLNTVGNYVSSEKDAGATNQWTTMDINSTLDGATIKLYTDSNNDQDWGAPSWTLRATLVGGNETDIDISGEDGRYFKYKVDVESGATVSTWVDDIDMYYGSTGAGEIRQGYYPSAKNWAKDLSGKFKWNFWFRSDTNEDLEVRMYTSVGNYFYRTLPVAAADTWEQHNILIGTGSTGWTSEGSPNWNDIDWLEFYISAAKTRTISYVDEQYFDAYLTSGYIISMKLLTDEFEYFDDVKFDCNTIIPSGVTITRKASNDDGANYDTCIEDTWTELTDHHSTAENHGRIFKYKIEFTGGTNTPQLFSVDIDVKSIPIVVLSKFERSRESRLQTVQRLANINNSDAYIDITPDLHFFAATTKASGKTISRQKGIWNFDEQKDEHVFRNKVYLHGALDSTFPLESDDYCEGDAGSWGSSNITLSDDTDIFKVGIKSIRGVIGLSGGWHDDCQDDVISTSYWNQHKSGSNTITEANGYIRCYVGLYPSNICFINYKEGTHDLSGDFDISFSVRTNNTSLEATICALVTNPPQSGTVNWVSENLDYIKFDSPNTIKLCRASLDRITLKTNINTNQWYQFRIKRVSTTHTIYIDGEQVWSGTTIVDNDHDNIQFGDFRTNEGQKNINIDYDNFSYGIVGASESTATSPSFTKNLDLYDNLHLWYRQDSLGSVTIRLRTDASNYYSWTITPTLINEFYELILPVGSLSAGWSSTGSPSWQNITDVMFIYPDATPNAIFNIDELCFFANEVIVYSELVSGSYGTAIYGIKELRIYDRSIKDRNYAGEIVKSVRHKLDDPLEIITFSSLLNIDIDPGDSVTLVVPDRGINGIYYIKDIKYNKGYKMKCVFTNSEINLEHLLLGFDTHDRGIAQGVVSTDAPEICVD